MQTISDVLSHCFGNLQHLISSGTFACFESEVSPQRWVDELGRLRVWAANTGAQNLGQSSLEYRLRDASHLKDETIKLLSRLLGVLWDVKEAMLGGETADDVEAEIEAEEDDEAENETELQQGYHRLVDTIDLLFKMSMAVCTPSDHNRLLNVDIKDSSVSEPRAEQLVLQEYPDADARLVCRLASAMVRQEAILNYRTRRKRNLRRGLPHHIMMSSTTPLASKKRHWQMDGSYPMPFEPGNAFAFSYTNRRASHRTGLRTREEAMSIPLNAPPESLDGKLFECPFCFYEISVSSDEDWTEHVFQDMMAYTCLSNNCHTPSRLYESRGQWMCHMRNDHPEIAAAASFTCPLCHNQVEQPSSYERHVGRHLEDLARYVLPKSGGGQKAFRAMASTRPQFSLPSRPITKKGVPSISFSGDEEERLLRPQYQPDDAVGGPSRAHSQKPSSPDYPSQSPPSASEPRPDSPGGSPGDSSSD
ncbi:hypothetical protein BJX61DRAFT_517607 [Aspergillus egyptiacus]|nr:hypothetical protein BJX61DRAFT_517607 [Aspergillus egyptiacus]